MFRPYKSIDIPWSTFNRVVQNAAQFSFPPPLGKNLNITEIIESLSLVDTSFVLINRVSPRPVFSFLATSLPFTGHGGHCDTKYFIVG